MRLKNSEAVREEVSALLIPSLLSAQQPTNKELKLKLRASEVRLGSMAAGGRDAATQCAVAAPPVHLDRKGERWAQPLCAR